VRFSGLRRYLGLVALVAMMLGASAASASAATVGALTPLNCFSSAALTGCTVQPGLTGPGGLESRVATSPDGKSVYVTTSDSTLVQFGVQPDGSLSYVTCIGDASLGGANPCPTAAPGLKQGEGGDGGMAFSPDGANLYVLGYDGDTIAVFRRDTAGPTLGRLTTEGCLANTATVTCDAVPGNTHGQAPGLDGPEEVAVSADGASVYVASISSSAVAAFTRDVGGPTPGRLTSDGCLANTGTSTCDLVAGSTHGQAPGLEGPDSLAISPDQANVYVSDAYGNVAALTRDVGGATPGRLGSNGCLAKMGTTTCDAVSGTTHGQVPGLANPQSVAISPDGADVYVGDSLGIVALRRDLTGPTVGRLTSDGCLAPLSSEVCDHVAGNTHGRSLGASSSFVAISPDGASLYSGDFGAKVLGVFRRDAAGGLSFDGCLGAVGTITCDAVAGATHGQAPGLARPSSAVLSPSGTALYVSSETPTAVAAFGRYVPPALPAPPSPSPSGSGPGSTLPASSLRIVSASASRKGTIAIVVENSGPGSDRAAATFKPTPPKKAKGAHRSKAGHSRRRTVYGSAAAIADAAGTKKLLILPNKAAKKALAVGKPIKVAVAVTFTPTGGTPLTRSTSVQVKLVSPRPHHPHR
jgi:DNA-binding beta-propeller fold protein YncE